MVHEDFAETSAGDDGVSERGTHPLPFFPKKFTRAIHGQGVMERDCGFLIKEDGVLY